MNQEQAKPSTFSCPACGFQVFNRRYTKCERCGSDLPASLLYSGEERQVLLEAEKQKLGLELKHTKGSRSQQALRRLRISPTTGAVIFSPAPAPVSDSAGVYDGVATSISETFNPEGGVFDGGGASGSFGSDSGPSGSSD